MTTVFEKIKLASGCEASAKRNEFASFTISSKIVQFPAFREAVKLVTELHERGINGERGGGLLITGQTGSGKTTLLNFYEQWFPRYEEAYATIIPVLVVVTPDFPSVSTLAEEILASLGCPAPTKGTARDKTLRIYTYLKECRVELLMLDEFQHFYDSKKIAEAKKVTDWLKNLFNHARIPVVLAGLPRSVMVVRSNPQLKRRFSSPYYLKPFEFSNAEDQKNFRAVLKSVHRSLPLECPPLHDVELARRFYYATHGLFDYLRKIVDQAVWTAGARGRKYIDVADFKSAFNEEVWRDAPVNLNPFSPNAVLRILNKPGEPFEIWDYPSNYSSRSVKQ